MIEIRYKCACLSEEVGFLVRFRRADESVEHWMEYVQFMIGDAHTARSPLCLRTSLEYAKIPVPDNAPFLGGKPVTN